MQLTPLFTAGAAIALAGAAAAQVPGAVPVTSNISTSTTWTAGNIYDLQGQIYVLPGATLTIEAGTVVASTATANGSGSLAVTNGAQINVLGTASDPVVMTSDLDWNTWKNGDPTTGVWRESANEWGNLTIMGDAYIGAAGIPSQGHSAGNTPAPNGSNTSQMEGLSLAPGQNPSEILFGGDDDNYDAGTINYLSIRYGGRVIGLGNELNGMSCGALGRDTEVSHVEIMNNVDDGIECWGGTVNFDHFSVWNIGDDSFDVDQGWRGQAQFGLIVQGYSLDASQGSGVGDNMVEIDGAENSDSQPVTTASLYNMTLIGQPEDGDGATVWRDNARVQYRQCVIMDCGERVVRFDNDDGDGSQGYGFNGTLDWPSTWTTAYNAVPAHPNDNTIPGLNLYQAQTSGNLAEIVDTVFFNNDDYTEAEARGVVDTAQLDITLANGNIIDSTDLPIQSIVRAPTVVKGGRDMQQVISLDPRAAGEAVSAAGTQPAAGSFLQPTNYRGAFDATTNWAAGWTAADAFCFFDAPASATVISNPTNVPNSLTNVGEPIIGTAYALESNPAVGTCGVALGDIAVLFTAAGPATAFPFPGLGCTPGGLGTVYLSLAPGAVVNSLTQIGFVLGAPVSFPFPLPNTSNLCGATISHQVVIVRSPAGVPTAALGDAVESLIGAF